jgi:N-acetylglucosaminyldiphosphoundecaprenol N-acetyl-beta-D-mannosaminyltransferase
MNKKKTQKSGQTFGKILGIRVISSSESQLLMRVKGFISHKIKFSILTPNPELILLAQESRKLEEALNHADLPIPDGVGLAQAAKYLSLGLPKNKIARLIIGFIQGVRVGLATFFDKRWLTTELKPVKGRLFFIELMKMADKNKWKIFLLGGKDDEAELAKEKLTSGYKNIKILSERGPILDKNGEPDTDLDRKLEKDVIDKINKFTPEITFVAFGNPKQEIWIHKNLSKLNIGGAMAVGGAFRYVAGISKLPPKWMEEAGLEWLWRLTTEPRRIKRIFNAWPLFPLKVFLSRL